MSLRSFVDKILTAGWMVAVALATLFFWKVVLGLIFFSLKTTAIIFLGAWAGGVLFLSRNDDADWIGPRVRILYDDVEEEDLP